MDKKNCCNCSLRSVCKIFNYVFENLIMDTNSAGYSKLFGNVYIALAEACYYYVEVDDE